MAAIFDTATQVALSGWRRLQQWQDWTTSLCALCSLVCTDGGHDGSPPEKEPPSVNEPWSSITPARVLVYHPCFDGFQCARVDLPMNRNRTEGEDDERVQLAVAKLPARVPITDERYGGMLWLQDGGPGLSGVDLILSAGDRIQRIVDSPLDPSGPAPNASNGFAHLPKYFDILAIDSRGLNNSTPCFSCFPTLASREAWAARSAAEGVIGSSNVSFQTWWARMQALGSGCAQKAVDDKSPGDRLALHVNTTPQIADMVAILELHGKWREREARRVMDSDGVQRSEEDRRRIVERTRRRENGEKINFWGFSYGTVIGATFAAMQPHRVGRVVIDGVVDTEDYYTGRRLTALFDTDLELERLAEHCYAAGPERCALYTKGGPKTIIRKIEDLIEALKRDPIGVPGTVALGPQLITYSDVVGALFNSLYAPIQELPNLAKELSGLLEGNGSLFAISDEKRQQRSRPEIQSFSRPYDQGSQSEASQDCLTQWYSSGDTRAAIICTDTNQTFGMTQSDFEAYIRELQAQSSMFAGMFAQVRMKCIAWNAKPRWRFPGPFAGNPASPMLMVSTLADPVTPIRNAHVVAERFPGSALLGVDGEGHCSLSSPSLCAAHHIRRYFQTGTLPPKGTVCDVDERTFLGMVTEPPNGGEDRLLLEDLKWLARHWT